MKVKSLVGSSFLGTFPCDSIHKAMMDVSARLFIHSYNFRDELIMDNTLEITNFCKLYQRILGTF